MSTKLRPLALWVVFLIGAVSIALLWGLGDWNDPLSQTILYDVRVPRVLEALVSGIGLTLAGQLFQTLLNNPLADSYTLGLASGATFGSGLAVALGLSFSLLPIFSVIFSLVTLSLVLIVTTMLSRGYAMRTLILSGIMIGALFNAFLYIVIQLNQRKMNSIVSYMFGGFSAAEYKKVIYIGLTLAICLVILALFLPQIKILQLGELRAQSLGLKVRLVSYVVLVMASVITAVIVAYVGIIGFIGMVIPQLIRRVYPKLTLGFQITFNSLIGASVMVLADWLGSTVVYPVQIPASIVLALLGIPVLFYLMMTEK